jgi:hypothetical protein
LQGEGVLQRKAPEGESAREMIVGCVKGPAEVFPGSLDPRFLIERVEAVEPIDAVPI